MKKLGLILGLALITNVGLSQTAKEIRKDPKNKMIHSVVKHREFKRKKNNKFMAYYKISEDQKSLICAYDFDSNGVCDATASFPVREEYSKGKLINYPAERADLLTIFNETDYSKRVCFYDGDKDGKFDIVFEGGLETKTINEDIKNEL